MKRLGLVTAVATAGMLAGGWFWQHRTVQKLRAENAALNAAAAELDLLKEEADGLRKGRVDAAEVERARQSQAELLRLRGEVSQLREQLKKEREARGAAEKNAAARASLQNVAERQAVPVETFSATLRASLAPQQTLVTGGWTLPNGNRAIVFVEPALIDASGNLAQPGEATQVVVQARFAEMPDEVLEHLNLQSMRTSGKESSAQTIMEPAQQQWLREQIEKSQGVNVLSAPRVVTMDGRQARIEVTRSQTVDGTDYSVGPSLDVLPKISSDGRTLEMTVVARIRQATSPQK
jgi:hypothetical protein